MVLSKRVIVVFLFLAMVGLPIFGASDIFQFPYNEPLSTASDITVGIASAIPALLAFAAPPEDWLALGTSYIATYASSYAVRTVLKNTISAPRPYVGETVRPSDTSEDYQSFPSGHSLMAFSSAAYTQTMFNMRYPDSPYKVPVTVAAWSLAASTAVLRVVSGNHYIIDVVGGAAIGSALGFLGPYITNKFILKDKHAPQVYIGPTMVGMQVSL